MHIATLPARSEGQTAEECGESYGRDIGAAGTSITSALDLDTSPVLVVTKSPTDEPAESISTWPKAPFHRSTPNRAGLISQLSWTEVVRRGLKTDSTEVSLQPPLALSNQCTILPAEDPAHPGDAPAVLSPPPAANADLTPHHSTAGENCRRLLKEAVVRRPGGS